MGHGIGLKSSERKLPAKDRSIGAAKYVKPDDAAGAAKSHSTEYRIAENPGLVLIVMRPRPGGQSKRIWRCRYSVTIGNQRHRRKIRLGTYPSTTLADARAAAATIMAEVDRGGDPFIDRKKEAATVARARLTFGDLVDDYIVERSGLVSIAEIERELRKDAIPALGSMRPSEITPADVDRLARTLVDRGTSYMARRLIARLRALFSYVLIEAPALAERYGIVTNPAASVGRRRAGSDGRYGRSQPRERVLTDGDIRAFWHALDDARQMRDAMRLTLKLILTTAQRPGEVRRAHKGELQLQCDEPLWVIPSEHSKNDRPHTVPLSPLAHRLFVDALKIRGTSALVLPGPSAFDLPATKVAIPTAMANLFRSRLSKFAPATPHDLRRTAATGMRGLGISRDVVGLVLGHTPPGVTAQHYDHHEGMPERRDALDRWAVHLERIVGSDLQERA